MRYSKEAYRDEQGKLREAESREHDLSAEKEQASEAEKLADFTYANVAGIIDFLRGSTTHQHEKKLQRLYESAHEEALRLRRQHEALQTEVREAWSLLSQAVERLKRFETEQLGSPENRA